MPIDKIELFMDLAVEQAMIALDAGDYPIGAVLVVDGRIFPSRNTRHTSNDKKAHAEVNAIKMADDFSGGHEKTIYVTLEPCGMCARALMDFGIQQVYYLLEDPVNGGIKEMPGVGVVKLDRPDYRRLMMEWLERNKTLYPEHYDYFTRLYGSIPNENMLAAVPISSREDVESTRAGNARI